MNQAIDGFDYASISSTDTSSTDKQSLYALLAKRGSIDYSKTGTGKLISFQGGTDAGKGNFAVFFRDGTALMYSAESTLFTGAAGVMEDDNMVHGIPIIFDTNGSKGPNILSNCKGIATGAVDGAGDDEAAATDCTSKLRVIKDQFGVRLRGGYAVPNGAAARWAYEN